MNKLIVVSIVVGAFVLQSIPAVGQVSIYTTTNDFGLGSGGVTAPSTAWDYNGSTVNGAANATPGGTGTAGSLAVTPSGSELGWTIFGDLYTGSFSTAVLAFDPGFSGGTLPEAIGTVTLVYTLPDNAGGGGGTYFSPMIGFNMTDYWNAWGPDSTAFLGSVGGLDTYEATFSYTVPATASLGYFNLMIGANSDYAPIETFYFDDVNVTEATVVPEPTAISLFGVGALALGFLARRSKKS